MSVSTIPTWATRGLYAYAYERMIACPPLMALLDTNNGIRRMDRPEKATYQKIVSFGRIVRANVPGRERLPQQWQSMKFSIWVRPEVQDMGDLVLEDIEDLILKIFVWKGSAFFQDVDCEHGILKAELVNGSEEEPMHDTKTMAWTKSFRIRFLVNLSTCLPIAEWCGPCAEFEAGLIAAGPVEEETAIASTAFNQVSPSEETFVDPDYDLYVCHPSINTAALEAHVNPASLKLFYGIVSLMPRFSSAYFAGQRAVANESDFWHSSTPAQESNRIEQSSGNWYVRPSASLGQRVAAYILGATSSYFDGMFLDESQWDQGLGETFHVPNQYWEAWKGVAAADNGGVPLTDADRPYWEGQWHSMLSAMIQDMKQGFGSGRALLCNSAGAVWPGADGISIEEGHVNLHGQSWALARFQIQKDLRAASPAKFGSTVLNIAWNSPIQVAGLVYLGTDEL